MSRDSILNLIGRMHAHQAIIAEAFHQREIVRDEDNERAISILQQLKVLVPRTQDTLTLHTRLRDFLNVSLNVERIFQQGSEIGASFERLEKLADSLFDAAHDGRVEDRDSLEDEIQQTIYEIADGLAGDLAHLRALVENRFAVVSTLAEKRRQNAYYIGRTEKLVNAIELFTLSDLSDRIQSQAPFANVTRMFSAQLLDRLPAFRQNLTDILAILQNYLFKFREIESRTKRVRDMWLFLERHQSYEPKDWDESAHPPAWLLKASRMAVKASPSVRDPAYTDELALLAREIAPPEIRLPVTRIRGHLKAEEPEIVVDLVPKRHQQAIDEMLAACLAGGGQQSALAWRQEHTELAAHIEASLWVQCVLELAHRPRIKRAGLVVEADLEPHPEFDGNVLVKDVFIRIAT